jgi:hypothetical protein
MFWGSCCGNGWMWLVPVAALPVLFIALACAAAWDAFTAIARTWLIFGGLLLADLFISVCLGFAHFVF